MLTFWRPGDHARPRVCALGGLNGEGCPTGTHCGNMESGWLMPTVQTVARNTPCSDRPIPGDG